MVWDRGAVKSPFSHPRRLWSPRVYGHDSILRSEWVSDASDKTMENFSCLDLRSLALSYFIGVEDLVGHAIDFEMGLVCSYADGHCGTFCRVDLPNIAAKSP